MAAPTLAPLTARVLIQYGDQEPTELFMVEAPITLHSSDGAHVTALVDTRSFLRRMRRAFRAAARMMR